MNNNNSNQNQFYSNLLGSDMLLSQLNNDSQNDNLSVNSNNNSLLNNMNRSITSDLENSKNGNRNIMGNNSIDKGLGSMNNSSLATMKNSTSSLFDSSTLDLQNGSGFSRERPLGAGHRYNSHSMNFLPMLNNSPLFNQSNSMSSISNSTPWANPQDISSKINNLKNSPALKHSSPFIGGGNNVAPSMYTSTIKSPLMDYANDNSVNNMVKSLDYLSLDNILERKKMNGTLNSTMTTSLYDNYQNMGNEDRGFNNNGVGNTNLSNNGFNENNMIKNSGGFNDNINNNVNELSQILKSFNNNPMVGSNDQFMIPYHSRTFSSSMADGFHSFNDDRAPSVISNSSNTSSNGNFPPSFNTSMSMNTNSNDFGNDSYKNKFVYMEEPKSQNILAMNVLSGSKSPFQRSAIMTHRPKASSITQLEKFQIEKKNSKSPFLNISHRRVASMSVNARKFENKIPMNSGILQDKTKNDFDDNEDLSLTLNINTSNLSNEVLLNSGSSSNDLTEYSKLNDEETLTENQNSLQIDNIDSSLTSEELKSKFAKYGEIESVKMIPEKEMAIVTFEKPKDAIFAKNEMNGKTIGKNEVQISFHKIDINEITTPTKSLWIGNIPPTISPSELETMFSKYGPIESARMLTHKTCGFINFENIEDAIRAKEEMNGMDVNGTSIKIGYAKVPFKTESHDGESIKSVSSSNISEKEKTKSSEKSVENVSSSKSSQAGLKKELPQLTIPMTNDMSSSYLSDNEDEYFTTIPTLSDHLTKRQVDQNRLREMRKKLEGHTSAKEIESFFNTIMLDVVGLCTDYIGNVIVQKVLDRTSDANRMKLIEKLSPHLATVGIHKNGTWVVQKIIDEAKGPEQVQYIINGLKKYTPPLLLDQFGNYVIQCCLRLGTQNNQFIFDAMAAKCAEIGPGRFGARAIRACLESQHTTKRQQKQVAMSIVQCSAELCINPNGALLITWLLDTSSLPGRFRVIAPKLIPNIASFCCNKLASSTILKLVNQRIELDARNTIIKSIFYQEDSILQEILSNPAYGVSVIQKILASACINNDEKIHLADRVRTILSQMNDIKPNQVGYKRLFEELGIIPTTMGTINPSTFYGAPIDIVSPLTPTTPMSSFFNNLPNEQSSNMISSSSNINISEPTQASLNTPFNDSFALYQQQQQQQQQVAASALEGYEYQNPYYSLINNSSSAKFSQLQGYGNGMFNSQNSGIQEPNNQFNNIYGNKNYYQQALAQKQQQQQQQQQQQINPYSLLMNSVPSLSYYNNNYGSQSSSPTMSPSTLKAIKVSSPPSSPSSSMGLVNNSFDSSAQASSILNNNNANNNNNNNNSNNNNNNNNTNNNYTPKMTIQIPPSPPLSLPISSSLS